MCRRFAILWNIEQTSIDELYAYLYRLGRLYIVFLIISIVELIANTTDDQVLLIWAIAGIVLYAINVIAINYTASHKETRQFWHVSIPFCTTTVLAIFDVANLINLLVVYKNLWALFSILSIILQLTTILIFWHLRAKMIAFENEKLMNGNAELSSSSTYNPQNMNRV